MSLEMAPEQGVVATPQHRWRLHQFRGGKFFQVEYEAVLVFHFCIGVWIEGRRQRCMADAHPVASHHQRLREQLCHQTLQSVVGGLWGGSRAYRSPVPHRI